MKSTNRTWTSSEVFLICLYLVAIVASNLIITVLGPNWSIVTAAVFIGLDLTTRDKLHEVWAKHRWLKMGALIVTGSAISYALNQGSGQIAIASMVAFGVAATLDAIVYQLAHRTGYMTKVNASNVFGAIADSIIFPTIAFGGFMPLITLGQFAAKVVGGFIWALILRGKTHD